VQESIAIAATDLSVIAEKTEPVQAQSPTAPELSVAEELEQLRRHYGENGGHSAAVLLQIQQMEALVAKQQQQQQQQQQLQQLQQQQQLFQIQQQQQLLPFSLLGETDRDRQIRMLEQEVMLMKRKMELDTMLQGIQQQQMQLQRAWMGDSAQNPVCCFVA
jgi:cell division protein FtsN